MAIINFYRGLKEKYNQETHKDGLYFSTDSLEILLNGSSFGGGGLEDVTFSEGKLIFSFMNGNSLEVTIDEATQDLPGLLSAIDKQKLDNLPTGSEITEGLDKIGDNNYEGTNYITGQTNLTDAVVKLDSQLKSTDDTVKQLNQAAVKEIQVNGSKISAVSGVVNIPLASQSADGVLSKEDKAKLDKVLDTGEGTKYLTDNGTYVPLDKNSVGLGNVDNTADLDKPISTATQNALNGKVDKSKGKSLVADTLITKLKQLDDKATIDAAIADKIPLSQKGAASGVATLDENGKVPVEQLNGALAKVFGIEKAVANQAALPEDATEGQRYYTIDTKKIYERLTDSWDEGITPKEDTIYNFRKSDATGSKDRTNILYRWDGADLVEISSSLALGETSGTAYAGDKGKDLADKLAKVRNTLLSHINDTDTFSATAEKVSLNYDCYVGDRYGAEAVSHSVDIPVASETQAGIVTAEDKKAIIDLDTTYAKKADVDKSIKDLSDSIAAGGVNAVVSLAENSSTAYAKSYVLSQGNKQIGTINIPKDMVVSSGSLKSVTSANDPYTGAKVGDKYIDLVIANSTSEHIYIPVSDLIDTYLAGDGLTLENSKFSIKKDATSESYLTVSADGVKVSGIDSALEGKVDKEEGKSLVLTTEITKLAKLNLPDAELKESENTVQNKAIKAAIDEINTRLTWTILD